MSLHACDNELLSFTSTENKFNKHIKRRPTHKAMMAEILVDKNTSVTRGYLTITQVTEKHDENQ
jgi:hypothetical protein